MGAIYYPSGANSGPGDSSAHNRYFTTAKNVDLMNALGSRPNAFSQQQATDRAINHPCPKPIKQVEWMVSKRRFPAKPSWTPSWGPAPLALRQ